LLLRTFAEAERQMYAVLDSLSLADLMADFRRSTERMSWLHTDFIPSSRP
jgi:DNA-binding IscR family transcriptional regulator